MKKLNQKGFGAIEVILIVVIVGLLGVAGWFTYKRIQNKDSSTSSSTSATDGSSSAASTTTSGVALEIPELNIKVNDPDNRGLKYEAVEETADNGNKTTSYLVRDNDDAYFNECGYPASISEISESNAAYDRSNSSDYYYSLTKQIGDKWYQVHTGTHYQAACKVDETTQDSAYKDYEDGIRQYIADNLEAL